MVLIFLLLLLLGLPIFVSLGVSAIIVILFSPRIPLNMIPNMMFHSVDSFILVAVPLFMLTGNLMLRGGMAQRLFNFANATVGWLKGGLGAVNIVASMIFGGMSGSSVADAAGLGPIEIESMVRFKYPKNYAAAISVASSTLSVVIPPSILLLIYAVVAEVSVAEALIAGIFPGIFLSIVMILVNYLAAKKNNWGVSEPFKMSNFIKNAKQSFLALLTPVVLLGGIISGIFTPTESASIAVLYAFLISRYFYKEMETKEMYEIITNTAKVASVPLIIIGVSSLTSFILVIDQLPMKLSRFLLAFSTDPNVIMLVIIFCLILIGCFMAATVSLIIFTPIFMPVISQVGIDPIHFGIIMVGSLAIGELTPPVGGALFAMIAVSKLPMEDIVKRLVPFYIMLILGMIVLAYFPSITLILPRMVFK